ncbi:hypothetical protein CSKR_202406 [Clonorchis sinensis]|uniref:FMRFamide-activated amiloride-sensitive sodium channel n=1 Tax=Clonorchis sinensis TaxID=79923 RepID=A0A8T1MW42_CLOSI|nr:hypothetical protein CSKR_202406 [Clonorchis sinensis]
MAITSSNLIKLVSDTFTIRGVPRLNRGPRFLRGLWWFFVITMTVGLFLTSYYLVQDYLLYDVAVNVHVALDAHSPFPALTVCHHHPFSAEAYRLWRENKVLSPSAFNREMRKLTQYHLERNNLDISSNLYQYDSMSIYYQNLNTEDAYRLGHDTSIFLNCMRRVNQAMQIEDDCTKMDGFRIRKFSHHTFFNCHTIEPTDKMEAEATDTIALVVGLGPKPDYSDEEQAFLMDLYEMAQGLRVVVHEPGAYPDLEREGLHVEPGKLNEINYQPIHWQRLNTPRHPCRTERVDRTHELASITSDRLPKSPSSDYAYAYTDLNVSYRYTQSQCIHLHMQLNIIDKCQCQYIYNPRPKHPSKEVPYCGSFLYEQDKTLALSKRIECLNAGPMNTSLKRIHAATKCFPLCNYYSYESTMSVTTWRTENWQLHWLRHLNNAFQAMQREQEEKGPAFNVTKSAGYARWKEYLDSQNLTNIPTNDLKKLNLEGSNFAYVVLRRRSQDLQINKEKLVLSISVLLSRIGGLCSLTIGLTAAFVVELIEFTYLLCTDQGHSANKPSDLAPMKSPITMEAPTPIVTNYDHSDCLLKSDPTNRGRITADQYGYHESSC